MKIPIVYQSAEAALSVIQPGNRVYIQGSAQTPTFLLKELARQANRLKNVELVFISVYGDIQINKPEFKGIFNMNSMFVSESIRKDVNEGRADYIPVFLSEIPELFKQNILPIDVALVQVSPPDVHGYCSLGVSVDIARSAVNTAKFIIAQVNPNVPRTHGDGLIHSSRFQSLVYCEDALHEMKLGEKLSDAEKQIGKHVASLIEDRSTLQMGIGSIPDAVLQSLSGHKDLGVHTEMCSDGIIDLFENDIINNKYKSIHPHKTVTGFALGTKKLYNYVDDNPAFQFLDIDYVKCADSIGTYQYSGVGGQMDFMRGAALSEGGKPIIALPSRTAKGISRIVPVLKSGAGVTTTRAHAHYVVTEYGIAYLFGKNLRQRTKALINIAHPDEREALEKVCFERFKSL